MEADSQIANTTPTLKISHIQNVTTIPPLLQLIDKVAPRKYETKALANNKVKV
jgi:hypothetical protein